jgi:hypothetical protein
VAEWFVLIKPSSPHLADIVQIPLTRRTHLRLTFTRLMICLRIWRLSRLNFRTTHTQMNTSSSKSMYSSSPNPVFQTLPLFIRMHIAQIWYIDSQLTFLSLYQIWARSHDGHFVYYPDLLTKAFEFGRQLGLVSISKDGTSLPEIKIYGKFFSSQTSIVS